MRATAHRYLVDRCRALLLTPLLIASSIAGVGPPALVAQGAPPQQLLDGFEWRNIGPLRGGRTQAVAGHPDRPLEYFFGATGGGLWRTTDGGTEWEPVTDGQISTSSIGAIGWAESNADVIYFGGGETELRGSITQGDGMYKSEDGGETWMHIGLRETQAIARIRVHPEDENLVYVAALGHPYGPNPERGVFRSRDGGANWERILHVSDSAGAVDLILDPSDPAVIYATTWRVYRKAWKMWGGGPDSGLWKSNDGGDTWNELTRNPGMPEGTIGKIGVAVSPADPNRLYAIVEAEEGGVFRSDDAGATWERTNDERKIRQRHFYYSRIYADPADPDVSYALNTRLFKSIDAGVTYETLRSQPPHGDHHDLWIAPNDPLRMIDGSDGGGSVSINGGRTWTEQDYSTTQLYHVMATSDFPYHVCGAQQDNSTVCVPSDGWDNMQARGPNHGWFYSAGGGESGYITQSPVDRDVFYAGSQGALLTRYNRSTGQIRDIQPYPRFFSGEPASALPERWQWTFPIVFSPLDSNRLYITSQHVWLTENDGQTWRKISPDLTLADPETLGETGGLLTMDMNGPEIYATVFALTPSRHDANTIWAGSDDGLVHITQDHGESWQQITPPDMPHYTRVSIIEESSHAPGTAYVAANRYQVDDRQPYVWRTTDHGKSWTKIVDGIADGHFARAVREDPVRPGLLYLGTEHTAYVSFDAGDHWSPLTLNLPDTPIRDLVTTENDVVLGTHGRGFWILDDVQPLRQWSEMVASADAHLFQPRIATRGVEDATIQYWLAEDQEEVTVEILDGGGEVIQTYTGTAPEEDESEEADSPAPSPSFGGGTEEPSTEAGLNDFSWDLRYPGATTFEGMIIWSGRPQRGPKAPPGTYEVRLTAAGESQTRSLKVRMDPRLEGVTTPDLDEQWRLAMRIRDATSRANEAVIRIREIKSQLEDQESDVSMSFVAALSEIEEDLYQVQNQSGQDPLNFPIKLNNRLASLRRSVENGDARPTDGAYLVFEELTAELEEHLTRLEELIRANQALVSEDDAADDR
jgi:photosystem II stability/assembly factor-like uncharacterized protein